MENFKKMLLIEPDLIDKLKKDHTAESPLSRLDDEMQKILHKKIEDREKWILYLQTLQRYLHFIGEDRQPYHLPIVDNSNEIINNINHHKNIDHDDNLIVSKQTTSDEAVKDKINNTTYSASHLLRLIPKTYLKKGELLLDSILENKQKLYWKNDGTVVINEETIPGSNIVDLLNDVLRPLKKLDNPSGWEKFSSALKDIKVPMSCIGNPRRFEYINKLYIKDIKDNTPIKTTLHSNTTPISNQGSNKIKRKIDWEKWTPY